MFLSMIILPVYVLYIHYRHSSMHIRNHKHIKYISSVQGGHVIFQWHITQNNPDFGDPRFSWTYHVFGDSNYFHMVPLTYSCQIKLHIALCYTCDSLDTISNGHTNGGESILPSYKVVSDLDAIDICLVLLSTAHVICDKPSISAAIASIKHGYSHGLSSLL
eukprot:143849_1